MYLGIDLSTQRIKATLLDNDGQTVICEENVHFDTELSHFKTTDGVHRSGLTVTTPSLLFVEAMDFVLMKLKLKNEILLGRIRAISCSGQQHGSVYMKVLPDLTLLDQSTLASVYKNAFSIADAPIWMDMSTRHECLELESAVVGAQNLASLTGSSAYERFTGSQIAKIAKTNPKAYAETERILLVSSFISTLLLGDRYADIDPSDGSGMNLLNIKTKEWVTELTSTCGGSELIRKLGPVGQENAVLGKINKYFVEKYGFNPECVVTTSSGDNPCTLSAMPSASGDLIISFGTSDTCMFVGDNLTPLEKAGHIFCNPNQKNSFMGLLCFRNASLAREKIRDTYAQGSWDTFNTQAVSANASTTIVLYFPDPEIQPAAQGTLFFTKTSSGSFIKTTQDPSSHCRAIIDSQTLLKMFYCEKLGLAPKRIIVVGGGAQNTVMVQTVANVFGVDVYSNTGSNSASLGACYRAMYAVDYASKMTYQEMMQNVHPGLVKIAQPDKAAYQVYKDLEFEKLMNEHF